MQVEMGTNPIHKEDLEANAISISNIEGFKRLLCRLEEYAALNKAHYNSVSAAIAREQAEYISMQRDALEEAFLTKVPYEKAMPPAEKRQRDHLNKQLATHNALKEKWFNELFKPMLEMIISYVNGSSINRIGSLQDAQQFALRIEKAGSFLKEMQKVGIEYTQQCSSKMKTIEAEISTDGSATRSSGSFGIPGAGAIEIDMSHYFQDADGFWLYHSPVLHLPSQHSRISFNSGDSFSLPDVGQFNGKIQTSCVYQLGFYFQFSTTKNDTLIQQ